LSTRLRNKEEKIQQIINKLIEESASGTPVIVEGKKDEHALRELGVNGKILTVKTSGKSFLEIAAEIETLSIAQVILLLDFDRRGREGTRRLKDHLEHARIKVDLRFWNDLHSFVGKEMCCVESLTSYLDTLQKKLL